MWKDWISLCVPFFGVINGLTSVSLKANVYFEIEGHYIGGALTCNSLELDIKRFHKFCTKMDNMNRSVSAQLWGYFLGDSRTSKFGEKRCNQLECCQKDYFCIVLFLSELNCHFSRNLEFKLLYCVRLCFDWINYVNNFFPRMSLRNSQLERRLSGWLSQEITVRKLDKPF